jgi:zinc protease
VRFPSPFSKRRLLSWAAVVSLSVAIPNVASAAMYNAETFMLKNGMQVVVIPNHRLPVIQHMVWYKVGAADDPVGKSGIAHFLEHLMFKGTKQVPAGEFSHIVARNGGRENAFTMEDATAYFQTVARDRLELVMKPEADRMHNLVIAPDQVASERQVIIEERRMRIDNSPSAQLNEQMGAVLFVRHPYGTPTIGWMNEMEGLTRADALAFYRRHYAPNNAILIVAGDITAKELKPLAEKYYGAVPRRDVALRTRLAEPEPVAARRVILKSLRVREPQLVRSYLSPAADSGTPGLALQVLENILAGGSTGRLYKKLVVEDKLAVSAGAHYDGDAITYGTFDVSAQPVAGVDLDKLEQAIDGEIDRLLKDGVSDEEVARAKSHLLDGAAVARDSLRRGTYAVGLALTTGRTVDDVENWPDRIKAVTGDEVMAAARSVLKPERSVTGLLLHGKGVEPVSTRPLGPAPDLSHESAP